MRDSGLQQGIALISVLWVVTILTLLTGTLVASQRHNTDVTQQWLNSAQARYAAEAGAHLGLYRVLTRQIQPGLSDETSTQEPDFFAGYLLQTRFSSEAGKADINTISEPLLRKMMSGLIMDNQRANRITDQILDWRDGDELVRLNGAERRDYLLADHPYLPANRPFEDIAELMQLLDMDAALYLKLKPLVTTYSGQTGIDMSAAAPELLEALGQSSDRQQFFNAASSRMLQIVVSAEKENRSGIELTTTLTQQPGNPRAPYQILAWDYGVPGMKDQVMEILPEQGGSDATQ